MPTNIARPCPTVRITGSATRPASRPPMPPPMYSSPIAPGSAPRSRTRPAAGTCRRGRPHRAHREQHDHAQRRVAPRVRRRLDQRAQHLAAGRARHPLVDADRGDRAAPGGSGSRRRRRSPWAADDTMSVPSETQQDAAEDAAEDPADVEAEERQRDGARDGRGRHEVVDDRDERRAAEGLERATMTNPSATRIGIGVPWRRGCPISRIADPAPAQRDHDQATSLRTGR